MLPSVVTSAGVALRLGRELGKGGEGSVLEVGGMRGRVAKLYHRPPDGRKQAKLRFMAASVDRTLLTHFAWPEETLHVARGGPPIGFLMQAITGADSIHAVYSPADRRERRPRCGWDFLVCVARNTAAAFAALHARGHVLGDVNQGNVAVAKDSRVVLIDCDSFQLNANGTVHPCEVGVSHFTPPELQGIATFDGVLRTVNHDNFGLALLVFHLLFGGRHPYSGVPLRSGVGEALETDIKAFRYVYARDAARRGVAPPPRSLPACLVPSTIERMLHSAFTEAGATGVRPTAEQWVESLDTMRRALRRCRTTAMHVFPEHLATCPWCDLERQGVLHFVDLAAACARPAAHVTLARVWGRIEAVPTPPPVRVPMVDARTLAPRPLPRYVPARRTLIYYRAAAVGLVAGLCTLAPQAWVFALIAGVFAWLLAQSFFEAPRVLERASRRAALDDAVREYTQILERMKREVGPEGFVARKALLAQMRTEYERLPSEEMRALRATRSAAQHIAVRSRYAARAVRLESALQRGAQDLQKYSEGASSPSAAHEAELEAAALRVAQAHKDLSLL